MKNEKIDFKGESEGGSQVTVKTVMKFVGSDITVDYSLMQKSGKYQVSDVAADGVSMVGNYRSAFSRVMEPGGLYGPSQENEAPAAGSRDGTDKQREIALSFMAGCAALTC